MASEWKEKAGGDDFDDEGLPLLRKHTQVRPASLAPVPCFLLGPSFAGSQECKHVETTRRSGRRRASARGLNPPGTHPNIDI